MSSRSVKGNQHSPLLGYIFILTPFIGGLSQHYQIFIVTIIALIVILLRRQYLDLRGIDVYVLIPIGLIVGCAFLTIFLGVSQGDSVYGFLHIVSAVLFLVMLCTFTGGERQEAIRLIPYVAVSMVLITLVAYTIPGLQALMYTNSRMGGPFGYPNTLAMYLLIGLYVFLNSFLDLGHTQHKITDYLVIIILLAGILFTGSRSTFVMTVMLLAYLFCVKKNSRKVLIAIIVLISVAVGVYVFITNDTTSVGRFLTISLESSTFLGRLLYDIDGLRMISIRPLGYGYLGYYFLEHYYQSGVYSVRFVHNDWLQIALDYGVAALLAFAWIYGLMIKRTSSMGRVILIIVGVHMLFDFDIQFFSILIIVLACYNLDDKNYGTATMRLDTDKPWIKGSFYTLAACISLVLLWMGAADFLQLHASKDTSLTLYPWAQDVRLHAMAETDDGALRLQYANELKSAVPLLGQPYDILSEYALSEGDITETMELKYNSVICQKYDIDKYEEYANLLCDIIDRYRERDADIYNEAKERLDQIPVMLEELEKNTNPLALKLNDKPEFAMSDKSCSYTKQ